MRDDTGHGGVYSDHNGTIGTYYAKTVIVPATGRAIAVSCNCASGGAAEQVDKLATRLALAKF